MGCSKRCIPFVVFIVDEINPNSAIRLWLKQTYNPCAKLYKQNSHQHDEGYEADEYAVALQPENPNVPGFIIDRSTVSVEDPWGAEDGGMWTYTHDALKPEKGKKVKWGKITITGDESTGFEVSGEGADFDVE